MYRQLLNYNSSPILGLSVKFVSQICHENINKSLDGAYLADFGIDIRLVCLAPTSSVDNFSRDQGHKTRYCSKPATYWLTCVQL